MEYEYFDVDAYADECDANWSLDDCMTAGLKTKGLGLDDGLEADELEDY